MKQNGSSEHGNGKFIQAVIFDLDGVLMDSEWISFLVWRSLAEKHGGELADAHYARMVGITAEETAEYVMQAANVRFDPHSAVTNVWREVTRRISSEAEPLPDAVELVSELAERGLPLAIASNSPSAYIQKALNGLGLSKYFGYTIGVDQVAQGKPAPEIYLRAAEALGAPPERCLAIEDSLAGSQSALNAGMRVLAVPQKHSDPAGFQACYRVFDSLGCIRREMESVLR